MTNATYRVALISIARPTFDVPLAQSVADRACAGLTEAGLESRWMPVNAQIRLDVEAVLEQRPGGIWDLDRDTREWIDRQRREGKFPVRKPWETESDNPNSGLR